MLARTPRAAQARTQSRLGDADEDTKEDDETKEEEDGHNVGFLDEKEEEEK